MIRQTLVRFAGGFVLLLYLRYEGFIINRSFTYHKITKTYHNGYN